jgi:hypothetical protein
MTLAPESKLGPYEILESIDSCGMSEVWKARDTRLGHIVAMMGLLNNALLARLFLAC